jgi:enediyne polyketide synthase
VEQGPEARRVRSDRAAGRLLGLTGEPRRRIDGRIDPVADRVVSVAHVGQLTLAVAGRPPLACDLEIASRLAGRSDQLLGSTHAAVAAALSAQTGDNLALAAARVWCAKECLTKAGIAPTAPLVVSRAHGDWLLLRSGDLSIATIALELSGTPGPVVAAVLGSLAGPAVHAVAKGAA